jgi:hypothetical protein
VADISYYIRNRCFVFFFTAFWKLLHCQDTNAKYPSKKIENKQNLEEAKKKKRKMHTVF